MGIRQLLLCLLLTIGVIGPAGADTIYLQADFDDKTIDAEIGTGGPEVGEPVFVSYSVLATVRGGPFATPCLELQDDDTYASGFARFEFLGNAEITTGLVVLSADLWFHSLSPGFRFMLAIRESDGTAEEFATLYFQDDGSVWAWDEDSYHGTVASYAVGRPVPLMFTYDMDGGTFDLWLDGQLLLDDEPHGVVGRGVGSIYFGCLDDSDLEGQFCVDNIVVTDSVPTTALGSTWGQLKDCYR
jgi:hypothetical protein